jgi:phosphotransferase system  glucose/maltose/N-acetylglucosamine-specific IIC component
MSALTVVGTLSMLFVIVFTWRAARDNTGVGQSPRSAIVEAWINIVIGFSFNWTMNLVLIPLMCPGGHMTLTTNFMGGWVYTAVSIIRQYAIRRWFNARLHAAAQRIAGMKG